jgi:hypothetical protein
MADKALEQARELEDLVVAFNSHFKTVASPEAIKKLLGSPHVRGWYSEYRQEQARSKGLPDDWAAVGLTAKEWTDAQAVRKLRREARAEAARLLSVEAATYTRAVDRVNATCAAALDQASTPMALALEGNFEQLPLAAQVRIESCGDPDARAKCVKTELKDARSVWVAKARSGEAPF